MAKFTAAVPLNIRLPGGFEVSGAAGATHRIPDALYDEFVRDQVPQIPGGVTWVTTDEVASPGNVVASAFTATSARFKGDPHYNVRAYGASGDGVTDDLAAFDAVCAAMPTAGGTIFVPAGSYRLSNSWNIDKEAVHVELDPNATIFTGSASTLLGGTISFIGYLSTAPDTASTPQRGWASIHGGVVYNSETNTLDNAIGFTRYSNVRCENVRIPQCGRKAITAQQGVDNVVFINNAIGTARYDAITVETACDFVAIIGNSIASAVGLGINANSTITDLHIERNTIGTAGQDALNASGATRFWVRDNVILGALGEGIFASNGGQGVISGNHVAGMTQHGISLSGISTRLGIFENYIDSTGMSATATYDGIVFSSCVRPTIVGNQVSGAKHRHAVNALSMSGSEPVVFGNIFAASLSGVYGGWVPTLGADIDGSAITTTGTVGFGAISAVGYTTANGTATTVARSDHVHLSAPISGARVFHSAAISINDNSNSPLGMTSERHDAAGYHESVTNPSRLTVPAGRAGKHRIAGHVAFASNSVGLRDIAIRLNGATFIAKDRRQASTTAGELTLSISTEYDLIAGDYVELVVFQNSGGALNISAAGNYSPEFSISFIGT